MPIATLNMVRLDRRQRTSLHSQLYWQIRKLVISRQLTPGIRLPSTRDLVTQLGVSRNTIVNALDQLVSEGYLHSQMGSGIYVADLQTKDWQRAVEVRRSLANPQPPQISPRAVQMSLLRTAPLYTTSKVRPFRPCQPALDLFPIRNWNRARAQALRSQSRDLFSESDPAGSFRLRRALVSYLREARGVRCSADQIVITAGTQQALSLIAATLLEPGDPAWIEDPGYLGARAALMAAKARLTAVQIDAEGLTIPDRQRKPPRLIYCTPSRQFPLGTTMSLSRRLALLDFALSAQAWIIEDDYDSEFRYVDRPLPSLQGLTNNPCVIYTGSFSKVLFPSLRLGYLVLPDNLVDVFRKAKEVQDAGCSMIDQATAAVFIQNGFFSAHVRRMRRVYKERLEVFLEEAKKHTAGWLTFAEVEAGMDITGWLEPNVDDSLISKQLAAAGIDAPPLSEYSLTRSAPGLVFGFTAFSPAQIRMAMRTLTAPYNVKSARPS